MNPQSDYAFEVPFQVRSYELDSLGHVNNAVYLSYLEEASFVFLTEHDLPFSKFAEMGYYPILARVEIDYKQEINASEQVLVLGWAESYGTTSMTIGYEVVRASDRALLARAKRVWVFVHNEYGKMNVPPEIKKAFGPARTD